MNPYRLHVIVLALAAMVTGANGQAPVTVQVTKPAIRDIDRRTTFRLS